MSSAILVQGDYIEATLGCDAPDSQVGVNVLHYLVGLVAGTVNVQMAADAIAAYFSGAYIQLLSSTATFSGCKVRIIFPLPASSAAKSAAPPVAGNSGSARLPEQVSGLIKKMTGLGGRHGRGRLYVPFPSSVDSTPLGYPSAGYLVSLANLASLVPGVITVGSGVNTAPLTPMILNRKKPLTLASVTPVSGAIARTGWATQRRRGYFGHHNLPF